MILGVDPKVDYAFKHMLGRDVTRPILIDVIDSVLNPAPEHRTRDVVLLNPFNPKEALDDKLSILDIKARDQAGRQLNIEMQMLALRGYPKRIVYYGSKFHQQQFHEGEQYHILRPTISISFLNYVLFPNVPDYHLRFRLLEESRHFLLCDDLEFHILELPKFTKTADELTSVLDIWLYFLRHAEKIDTDALPPALQRPEVLRALEELKVLTQTEIERERYEARRKAQLDHNSLLFEAREEGLEQGLEQGLERGEKIGTIHFCEQFLSRPQTPTEQLASLPLARLDPHLAQELQEQVLKQR